MKPKNTKPRTPRQKTQRRDAIQSAVFYTLLRIVAVGVLLWVRAGLDAGGFLSKLLFIVMVLDVGSILPIWLSLKERLQEIEGGEEDAAAQY